MKQILLENKKILIILIVVLLLSISGLTLAYFAGQIGPAATANVTLTSRTVDNLTFTTGNDITIGPVNQSNFAQGSGNKSGSTTASATLKSNTGNNSATNTYNVYLKINQNTFEYTTLNNTAELVLKVTNPAGSTQTISGLTSVTSGGVTGYDITNKIGLIQLASNYTITTTSTKTDTWTVAVYFINLNSDQQANTSKTFNAEVIIEKEDILLYNYTTERTFSSGEYVDTNFIPDWTKNFTINTSFLIPEANKRHLIFGNYTGNGILESNIEIYDNNNLRVYLKNATIIDQSVDIIPANENIDLIFTWNANNKTYYVAARGDNVNISYSGTASIMNDVALNPLRVGAKDYRTGSNPFNAITINYLKIY